MNLSESKELTAYHEAGHVIMCLVNGHTFEYVTIKETDYSLGHVNRGSVIRSVDDISLKDFYGEVAILLGGFCSEKAFFPDSSIIGSKEDMIEAARLTAL